MDYMSLFSFENISWPLVAIYFGAQLINVILSTIKSVITIKGTRNQSVMVNILSYSISAVITVFVAKVSNVLIAVGVTATTNLIGVYLSYLILDKIRKEKLWLYQGTVLTEQAESLYKDLADAGLDFIQLDSKWNKRKPFNVYSYTREDTKRMLSIFSKYDVKTTRLKTE